MAKYVFRYLLITGASAALAVFVPGLVVLGFFLIIPGIYLALMPTAFLWGAIFAVVWWPVRAVAHTWLATAVALVATVAAVIAVPRFANTVRQSQIDALRLEDRDAAGPIPLSGVIRLERTAWTVAQMDDPDWQKQLAAFTAEKRRIDWSERPVTCDVLCAAVLFSPGIDGVIIAPMRRPGAQPRITVAIHERSALRRRCGAAPACRDPGRCAAQRQRSGLCAERSRSRRYRQERPAAR